MLFEMEKHVKKHVKIFKVCFKIIKHVKNSFQHVKTKFHVFFLFSQPCELHFTCFLIMVNNRKHVKICISMDQNIHTQDFHMLHVYIRIAR